MLLDSLASLKLLARSSPNKYWLLSRMSAEHIVQYSGFSAGRI